MMKRRTTREIERINNYENKWKIQTNMNKFKIIHVSKHDPTPINIAGRNINYSPSGTILGLKINKRGIVPHIKQRCKLATISLKKLKRFSKLTPRTKLHLYKALVLPIVEYPAIPLNIINNNNKYKLQSIQNKALRWAAGDRPPYDTTVQQLHQRFNMETINVRNFNQSFKVWETLRTHQQETVDNIKNEHEPASHFWWKKAYISEHQIKPLPIFRSPVFQGHRGGGRVGEEGEEE